MGTGTTSDADWACQGDEKNVQIFQIVRGELPALGTSREALSKGIRWAQARLQMQTAHARATRRMFFSDSKGRGTGLGTSREALSKGIPLAQARFQMQIGISRRREEQTFFSDSRG